MLSEESAKKIIDRIFALSKADQTEIIFQGTNSTLTRYANNRIHQNLAESPNKLKDRTFRVVFELPNVKKECKALKSKPLRFYRNPIALAQEWQRRLVNGECSSLAALSRKLRVSRARVTQLLRLLRLTPEVLNDLVAIGAILWLRPSVTERRLRPIVSLPAEEQRRKIDAILPDSCSQKS